MIVTSALIIWKGLIVVTGSESPVVVVLSGSMEPGFKRVSCFLRQYKSHIILIFVHSQSLVFTYGDLQ
jgi:signal peptidase